MASTGKKLIHLHFIDFLVAMERLSRLATKTRDAFVYTTHLTERAILNFFYLKKTGSQTISESESKCCSAAVFPVFQYCVRQPLITAFDILARV